MNKKIFLLIVTLMLAISNVEADSAERDVIWRIKVINQSTDPIKVGGPVPREGGGYRGECWYIVGDGLNGFWTETELLPSSEGPWLTTLEMRYAQTWPHDNCEGKVTKFMETYIDGYAVSFNADYTVTPPQWQVKSGAMEPKTLNMISNPTSSPEKYTPHVKITYKGNGAMDVKIANSTNFGQN